MNKRLFIKMADFGRINMDYRHLLPMERKKRATDLLKILIEQSNNEETRLESIERLAKIQIKNKRTNNQIFKILESCVISDENPRVTFAAAEFLVKKFHTKAIQPITWKIRNEKSGFYLIKFLNLIKTLNVNHFRDLIKEIYGEKIKNYISEGVSSEEGLILTRCEILIGRKFRKVDINDLAPCVADSYVYGSYYKVNESGNIIGIYISNGTFVSANRDKIILPEEITSFSYLEELYLKNLNIEGIIPGKLKRLMKATELHNDHYYIKNSYEQKINYLKSALEINPRYSLAWYSLAQVNNKSGYIKEALEACEAALKINSKFKSAILLYESIN